MESLASVGPATTQIHAQSSSNQDAQVLLSSVGAGASGSVELLAVSEGQVQSRMSLSAEGIDRARVGIVSQAASGHSLIDVVSTSATEESTVRIAAQGSNGSVFVGAGSEGQAGRIDLQSGHARQAGNISMHALGSNEISGKLTLRGQSLLFPAGQQVEVFAFTVKDTAPASTSQRPSLNRLGT